MRGISINDFTVTMETYGATRVENRTGSRNGISVPCFVVGDGVALIHSGSYYIVQRDNQASDEVMNQAMAVFGEKEPGGENFWYGEIHSISGLLTLASMLDGKYSKELVEQLTNQVYKKLLDNPDIKSNQKVICNKINSPKMKHLRALLSEYANVVNPYGNSQLHLKEPIEYLNSISVHVSEPDSPDTFTYICLTANTTSTEHYKSYKGWSYHSGIRMQKNRRNKYLRVGHYYNNGLDMQPFDEVVFIDYSDVAGKGYFNQHTDDIDLRISLNTGLAWKTYDEKNAHPVTDEELNVVISYLKATIKAVKHKIVNKMVIS